MEDLEVLIRQQGPLDEAGVVVTHLTLIWEVWNFLFRPDTNYTKGLHGFPHNLQSPESLAYITFALKVLK
jgi:hypothetical protein